MNALGQAKSWRNSLLSNSDRGSELDSRERHRCESAGNFDTLESIASGYPADPVARISEPAYDLIVQTESGGKAYYQRILKARITADGKFGARTEEALARYQSEVLGYADGLYHREMDGLFGWQVLGPPTA